ncbi:MAG TPA: phage tail tape measure protein, partial [Ktedonobacterales bacterium]|nr:phage tail tape measure protein [Ktedonobacterales bacterium]
MGEVSTLWSLDADSSEASASLDELIGSLDALASSVTDAAATAADVDALGESFINAATSGSGLDDVSSSLAISLGNVSASLGAVSGSADAAAGSLGDATAAEATAGDVAEATAAKTATLGESFAGWKMPLLIAGAAIVALGAVSVKMAGDFQSSMTQLVTGAGESASNLQMVSNGILAMAGQTGESTKQLAAGMYMIESAGYHGKAGLAVLLDAAEGAKVGAADLGTVADATTTILNDFGSKGVTASNAVNALIATVASGKTHMQDLAQSLSQILPTASAAGVGLTDVMGALATMTGEGVPAANAATYLRQTIIALDAPSKAATKAMTDVGLSSAAVASEMKKSLPGALAMITDAVGKKFPVGSAAYVQALKDISGGSKTMQGMLDLTGDHLATFKGNVAGVAGAVKHGGNSITGWGAVQGDFNQKMDRLGASLQVAAIKAGTMMLPALSSVAGVLANDLPGAINATMGAISAVIATGQRFAAFMQSNSLAAVGLKLTFVVLGGAILGFIASTIPPLIASFITWAATAGAAAIASLALAWPFIAVGAAIALVAVGIYELVTHWAQVSAFFENLGHIIVGFAARVWGVITGFFGRVAGAIGGAIQGWIHTAQTNIARVQHVFQAGFAFLVNLVEA